MKIQSVIVTVMVLLPLCVNAADTIEVVGVARVNDGSATATAWNTFQTNAAAGYKQTMDMMAQHNKDAVGASAAAGDPNMMQKMDGTMPAQWIVQIKPMPIVNQDGSTSPRASNFSSSIGIDAQKSGEAVGFTLMQGSDASDWIAVNDSKASDNDSHGSALQNQIQVMKVMLDKGNLAFTAKQLSAIQAITGADCVPELVDAWKSVADKPADKSNAVSFINAFKIAIPKSSAAMDSATAKLMAVITPEQLKFLTGGRDLSEKQSSHVSGHSNGPGSFGVSMVSGLSGTSMTVTITGKTLADAFDSLTGALNSSFNTKLAIPQVLDPKLAATIVSAKLTLTGPDGALEKLANAAGAKLETQGGNVVVVPAGK